MLPYYTKCMQKKILNKYLCTLILYSRTDFVLEMFIIWHTEQDRVYNGKWLVAQGNNGQYVVAVAHPSGVGCES